MRVANEALEALLKDAQFAKMPLETVLQIKGAVARREAPDAKEATGEVLVEAKEVKILSFSRDPLIFDPHAPDVSEKDRIRHRYLWLRSSAAHENFRFRTQVVGELRRHLVASHFEEVETPLLANRWTPDSKEAYFAIRDRKQIFALPGYRPIHGTLLMASGFDRTFEIARRFRRKASYGPWQQPEFDVLDISLAYVDETNLHAAADGLLAHVWRTILGGEHRFAVTQLTSEESWIKYGTDAPDLRFGLPVQDLTPLTGKAKSQEVRDLRYTGGAVRALRVAGAGGALRENDPALLKLLPERTSLHWLGLKGDGTPHDAGSALLDAGLAAEIVSALKLSPGDRALVAVSAVALSAAKLMGEVRLAVGKQLALAERKFALARVTRLPYFRTDSARGEPVPTGDPLTRPVDGDLDGDPLAARGYAFYLVLNGVNIGGGAIRNHDEFEQGKVFRMLRIPPADIDARYGPLIKALRFGVPPHGRIAIGVDRLVALLKGLAAIHEVIPMPKTADGIDPLTRSPWPIDNHLVRGLFAL